jgi:hypothetical protein
VFPFNEFFLSAVHEVHLFKYFKLNKNGENVYKTLSLSTKNKHRSGIIVKSWLRRIFGVKVQELKRMDNIKH